MLRSRVRILAMLPLLCFHSETAGAQQSAGRALPEVHDLPVTMATAVPIGLPDRNDKQGTLLAGPGAGFMLVFNSGLGDNDDLQLHAVASIDGDHIGPTRRQQLIDAPFVAQPAFVTADDRHWLYISVR